MRCTVGNGKIAFFWYDHWTPLGVLIKLLGYQGPRLLRISPTAKVNDVCDDESWHLPPARSDNALSLQVHLTTIPLPLPINVPDSYSWFVNGVSRRDFSAAQTWEETRARREEQPWANIIWYKGAVPKFAFHMWVTQLNRLPTRHRLVSWGNITSSECCICSNYVEPRDHLFLSCDFSVAIWKLTFQRLCPSQPLFNSWTELLSWLRITSPQAPSLLRKATTQTIIYHVWRQRSNLLHNKHIIPPSAIFRMIDRDLRNIISSRRHRKRWQKLISLWIR